MLPRIRLAAAVLVSFCWPIGCGGASVPAPEEAALRYAAAARRGDATALRALLTSEARQQLDPERTAALIQESRQELSRRGQALETGPLVVEESAEIRYLDGESARLTVEDGRFRVASASGLPERPETPAGALASLRRALARRSYPELTRVLSAESRAALESNLRTLVEGLQDPESLIIQVNGDVGEAVLPGGHKVWLRRESGVWRVDDFE